MTNKELEMKKVSIDSVGMNKKNPNVMDDYTMEKLKKNIKTVGYLEPAVVIPHKDGNKDYFIIDGEHRLMAMKDLGHKEALVVVAHGVDKAAAFSGAYTFNAIKGKIDSQRLGEMLKYGTQEFGLQMMKTYSQLEDWQLQEYLESQKLQEEQIKEKITEESEPQEIPDAIRKEFKELKTKISSKQTRVLMFSLDEKDYEFVNGVLGGVDKNPNKALVKMCNMVSE